MQRVQNVRKLVGRGVNRARGRNSSGARRNHREKEAEKRRPSPAVSKLGRSSGGTIRRRKERLLSLVNQLPPFHRRALLFSFLRLAPRSPRFIPLRFPWRSDRINFPINLRFPSYGFSFRLVFSHSSSPLLLCTFLSCFLHLRLVNVSGISGLRCSPASRSR